MDAHPGFPVLSRLVLGADSSSPRGALPRFYADAVSGVPSNRTSSFLVSTREDKFLFGHGKSNLKVGLNFLMCIRKTVCLSFTIPNKTKGINTSPFLKTSLSSFLNFSKKNTAQNFCQSLLSNLKRTPTKGAFPLDNMTF